MSHAPRISLFKSPAPSTGEAETVFSLPATVSAINPRFTAVYLYLSGIAQHTYSNLSDVLQVSTPLISFQAVAVLKRNKGVTHEHGNFTQERGFFSQGAIDD